MKMTKKFEASMMKPGLSFYRDRDCGTGLASDSTLSGSSRTLSRGNGPRCDLLFRDAEHVHVVKRQSI